MTISTLKKPSNQYWIKPLPKKTLYAPAEREKAYSMDEYIQKPKTEVIP